MKYNIRKDARPEDTIRRIETILEMNGIKTSVVSMQDNQKMFSSRIEFEKFPVGTNGKGVSEQLSLASGYAEFMERLQGKTLIQPYLGKSNIDNEQSKYYKDFEELKNAVQKYCYDVNEEVLKDLLVSEGTQRLFLVDEYYDVLNDTIVGLPENIVQCLCGSNGLCAGNTATEAICQGIFEVLEREVLKQIYLQDLELPTICPPPNCSSMEMINLLTGLHYTCIVKDCSLSGKYPVVGFLLIDPSFKKYSFTLGADINFDIALQRCVTEMFQGKKLDLSFPQSMKSIFDYSIISKSINKEKLFDEHFKQVSCGGGQIPFKYFIDDSQQVPVPSIFEENDISNDEVYLKLVKKFDDLNLKLYIKDCSFLGFPTYRVYIPSISNVYLDSDHVMLSLISAYKFRIKLFSKDNAEILHSISLLKANGCSYNNLESFLRIKLSNDFTQDLDYVQLFLYLKENRYKEAFEFFIKALSTDHQNDYIGLFLLQKVIGNGDINHAIFSSKICLTKLEEFKSRYSAFSLPNCDNCRKCSISNYCYISTVKDLYSKIVEKITEFKPNKEDYVRNKLCVVTSNRNYK